MNFEELQAKLSNDMWEIANKTEPKAIETILTTIERMLDNLNQQVDEIRNLKTKE